MRNIIISIRICGKATPQHEKVIYYAKYYLIWDFKTKTAETNLFFKSDFVSVRVLFKTKNRKGKEKLMINSTMTLPAVTWSPV